MAAVPKDSYLLLTVFAVVFMMYYLATRGINEMPPGFEAMSHPDQDMAGEVGGAGSSSGHALNGMELLRNPKRAPKVDHGIKGPIYNFNIPGLAEGWITLPDKSRVYKITVTPLGEVSEWSPTVLLLHASQYSPYAWVETGLLFKLRDSGFRAVAVDLPGHHASNHLAKLTEEQEHFHFITSILQGENLKRAVILAPEASASFVLPLVKREEESLRSLILVSPQHGFNYTTIIKSPVQTLLITGEFEHAQIKRYTSPHIEHIVMPLSANFFFVENSKQFNKIIIDYLKRLLAHDEKREAMKKDDSFPRSPNIDMPSDL